MEVCDADLEFLVSNSWIILVTVMSMTCRLANFNSFSIAIFICEREKGGGGGRRRKGGRFNYTTKNVSLFRCI